MQLAAALSVMLPAYMKVAHNGTQSGSVDDCLIIVSDSRARLAQSLQ